MTLPCGCTNDTLCPEAAALYVHGASEQTPALAEIPRGRFCEHRRPLRPGVGGVYFKVTPEGITHAQNVLAKRLPLFAGGVQ